MKKAALFLAGAALVGLLSWKAPGSHVSNFDDCILKGMYTGEARSSRGQVAPMTYDFRDNNLAVGMSNPTGSAATFGGYRSTCDSVFISVCYTANMSYYFLSGQLSTDKNTITGTYQNKVNRSDKGSFVINKL